MIMMSLRNFPSQKQKRPSAGRFCFVYTYTMNELPYTVATITDVAAIATLLGKSSSTRTLSTRTKVTRLSYSSGTSPYLTVCT